VRRRTSGGTIFRNSPIILYFFFSLPFKTGRRVLRPIDWNRSPEHAPHRPFFSFFLLFLPPVLLALEKTRGVGGNKNERNNRAGCYPTFFCSFLSPPFFSFLSFPFCSGSVNVPCHPEASRRGRVSPPFFFWPNKEISY